MEKSKKRRERSGGGEKETERKETRAPIGREEKKREGRERSACQEEVGLPGGSDGGEARGDGRRGGGWAGLRELRRGLE